MCVCGKGKVDGNKKRRACLTLWAIVPASFFGRDVPGTFVGSNCILLYGRSPIYVVEDDQCIILEEEEEEEEEDDEEGVTHP